MKKRKNINVSSNSSKIRAVGFDFDGTLILSESKKAQIMSDIFKEHFNHTYGVKSAYKKLVGKGYSRHRKFEKIIEQVLKKPAKKSELKSLEKLFGQKYRKVLSTCPLVACTHVIKDLKKQVNFLFLLSLEEREDVLMMAKHCGLAKYFDEVLGGPLPKHKNLCHVIKKHKLKPHQIIYIGDSKGDVLVSKKLGIKVVLIKNTFNFHKVRKVLQADFNFKSLCRLDKNLKISKKR